MDLLSMTDLLNIFLNLFFQVGFRIQPSANQRRTQERDDFEDIWSDHNEHWSEHLPSPAPLVSKDDYMTPWNSQERFFFTRPSASVRRRPKPPRDKFFVGDASQCLTGTCEFFLFCWLAGGVVEGSCGGFLQTCCNKPNQVGHKTIVTQVGPK